MKVKCKAHKCEWLVDSLICTRFPCPFGKCDGDTKPEEESIQEVIKAVENID